MLLLLLVVIQPSGAPGAGSRLWGAAAKRRVGRLLGARGRPRKQARNNVGNKVAETQAPCLTDVVTETETYRAVMALHRNVMFFPEIEEVGFSLDSIPGLRSLLRHFAVSPPRSRPRPHGSLELVEEVRSMLSDRRMASVGKSRNWYSTPRNNST